MLEPLSDPEPSAAAPRYVIKRLRLAHCKRGPRRCAQCRAMNIDALCLLDVAPPDRGKLQRRVTQVEVDGEVVWREFDIVRMFDDAAQALAYAEEHGIRDVQLTRDPKDLEETDEAQVPGV